MMKTAVFQKEGKWWFKWWNMAGGVPIAQDLDGPFRSKAEAEVARQDFVAARKKKYPHEQFDQE